MSDAKNLLCLFHWKPRLSGVSFESPELLYISQVPENREDVGQNHDARKKISATLSGLKWSGAIFRPRSSKVGVRKVMLCPFHWKPRQSGVSLESPGLENISPSSGKSSRSWSKSRCAYGGLGYSFTPNMKWGYISVLQARHRACSPFTCVHFTKN